MKQKLIEGLKARYSDLPDSIINRTAEKLAKTVTTEEQVDTAIDGTTIASIIESYADSRATEATNTAVINYEKKHHLKDGKPTEAKTDDDSKKTDPNGDEPPAWAKALIDQNKELAEKLQAIEGAKVTNERAAKLRETLPGAPDQLIGLLEESMPKAGTDDEFTAWLNKTKATAEPIVTAMKQKGSIFTPPLSGGKTIQEPEPSPEIKQRIAEREKETVQPAIKGLPK